MSFPYMNKVLESWHTNGIKTSSDVEKANKPVSSPNLPQNKSKANAGHASSYDLNEFNRNAMQKPIVYKKKTRIERGKTNELQPQGICESRIGA